MRLLTCRPPCHGVVWGCRYSPIGLPPRSCRQGHQLAWQSIADGHHLVSWRLVALNPAVAGPPTASEEEAFLRDDQAGQWLRIGDAHGCLVVHATARHTNCKARGRLPDQSSDFRRPGCSSCLGGGHMALSRAAGIRRVRLQVTRAQHLETDDRSRARATGSRAQARTPRVSRINICVRESFWSLGPDGHPQRSRRLVVKVSTFRLPARSAGWLRLPRLPWRAAPRQPTWPRTPSVHLALHMVAATALSASQGRLHLGSAVPAAVSKVGLCHTCAAHQMTQACTTNTSRERGAKNKRQAPTTYCDMSARRIC